MRILVVEDQKDTAETLRDELAKRYPVDVAYTGQEASYLAKLNKYEVILLDLGLPDVDGFELCRTLRSLKETSAIIVVSAKSSTVEKVSALNCGADDYLVKPFSFDELYARINAILRRGKEEEPDNTIALGDLILNMKTRVVRRKNAVVQLRKKEFDVLEFFVRNNKTVLTREAILENVWDLENSSMNNTVDVHIKYLRDKIDRGFDKKIILTVHGVGYKLDA